MSKKQSMSKTNGNAERESPAQEVKMELAAGEPGAGPGEAGTASVGPDAAAGLQPADSELDKLRRERDDLLDRVARLQAEFENARKRAVREQQEYREFALQEAVRNLLPILDSFERALDHRETDLEEYRAGVELIYKQMQDALAKLGLRPIPAQGEPFDPHLHQAIEMVETTEAPDQQVLEELQRGYKLKDRLLRPAMVRVARNSK
jgi:molecular chaperone GrpE